MPAIDDFNTQTPNAQGPISKAAEVTPNDALDLTHLTRAVFIGTGGDLRATLADGTVLSFVNMAPGWHPIRVARIWATGTTASDIIGGW